MKTIFSHIKAAVLDVIRFVEFAVKGYAAVTNPATKTLMVQLFRDVFAAVAAGEVAASGEFMNITLDLGVVSAVEQFVADVKAGEPTLQADIKALGIDFDALKAPAVALAAPAPAPVAAAVAPAAAAPAPALAPGTVPNGAQLSGPGLHVVNA